MFENEKRNKVKSITKKRGQLTLTFFDNNGIVKQKDTGLEVTKANRQKLYKLVPEFERKLKEKAQQKEALSFSYYADMFLELKKDITKYKQYEGYVKRFKTYFGEDTHPKDIKLTQVKKFFANLSKKNGVAVTRSTKTAWRSALSSIMQLALDDDMLDKGNIVANWKLPKQNDPPSTIRPFTPKQVKQLLDNCEGSMHNYIGIGVWTGLRPEEEIALMVGDIDFNAKLIHVRRAFSKHGNNDHTKTYQSMRTVPMLNRAVPFLKAQIQYAASKNSLYLFCKEDGGKPKSNEDITGHIDLFKNGKRSRPPGPWYILKRKVGLPDAHIHWTRHTFAVQALKSRKVQSNKVRTLTPQEIAATMGILLRTLHDHYTKYFIDNEHENIDREIDLLAV